MPRLYNDFADPPFFAHIKLKPFTLMPRRLTHTPAGPNLKEVHTYMMRCDYNHLSLWRRKPQLRRVI